MKKTHEWYMNIGIETSGLNNEGGLNFDWSLYRGFTVIVVPSYLITVIYSSYGRLSYPDIHWTRVFGTGANPVRHILREGIIYHHGGVFDNNCARWRARISPIVIDRDKVKNGHIWLEKKRNTFLFRHFTTLFNFYSSKTT